MQHHNSNISYVDYTRAHKIMMA